MSKKKSAMQKGYRKQVKAKPFLTKKDITSLIIVVAVIILGVILFNLFYDDGFMSANQVKENDLVTYASSDNRSRYKKVAEIGEKEGFARSSTGSEGSPISTYVFQPETEQGNLDSFTVGASFVPAATLTNSFLSYTADIDVEVMEPIETTVAGHPAYVFAYDVAYYDAANDPNAGNEGEAEAPVDAETAAETEEIDLTAQEPNTYEQNLSAYIVADDTHTVTLHVNYVGQDDSFFMPEADVEATIQQFADVINMDFAK